MRKWLGGVMGTIAAMSAAPALADGVADAKALVEKYSKLPTFEAPGPAFDAKACMAGKKIFDIPLTNANPFNVAISKGMEQAAQAWSASRSSPGRRSSRPTNGRRASTRRCEEGYNLIDLQGGLPPEFIAPQIQEARKKGVKVTVDPRLRRDHAEAAGFPRRRRPTPTT